MKIIYTRHFPPGSFHGINLCGLLFVNKRWGAMSRAELTHEHIHTHQQREMLWLPFFVWYVVEYLFRLVQHRGKAMTAYYKISFEREAYNNMRNANYLRQRKPFAWMKYL